MNFLELCESLFERVNRYPMAISSVDLGKSVDGWVVEDPEVRKVIRAVQDAYDFILNLSSHWDFLQYRGKLLDLVVGQEEYENTQFADVKYAGLHLRESISSARYPIWPQTYTDWANLQRVAITPTGTPVYLIQQRKDLWILWPKPVRVFELWGDARLIRPRLIDASDEPLWDEERHELVVDVGRMLYEKQLDSAEQAVQQLNVQAANEAVVNRLNALVRDYSQTFGRL